MSVELADVSLAPMAVMYHNLAAHRSDKFRKLPPRKLPPRKLPPSRAQPNDILLER